MLPARSPHYLCALSTTAPKWPVSAPRTSRSSDGRERFIATRHAACRPSPSAPYTSSSCSSSAPGNGSMSALMSCSMSGCTTADSVLKSAMVPQRVVLLDEVVAETVRVLNHTRTQRRVNACVLVAVSVEALIGLLQQLWYRPSSRVLRSYVVLDVRPQPFDGLDARLIRRSVDELVPVRREQLGHLGAVHARVSSQVRHELSLQLGQRGARVDHRVERMRRRRTRAAPW